MPSFTNDCVLFRADLIARLLVFAFCLQSCGAMVQRRDMERHLRRCRREYAADSADRWAAGHGGERSMIPVHRRAFVVRYVRSSIAYLVAFTRKLTEIHCSDPR